MAYGNARTCSMECAKNQKNITQKEYEKRRKTRKKKMQNTLLETEQKAREAGMSYGKYMAVKHGGMTIERSETDG